MLEQEKRNFSPIEIARRLFWCLHCVERATGLKGDGLPLAVRLDNALLAAMDAPAAVDPGLYKVLYMLRYPK